MDPLVHLPGECCFRIFSYLRVQELGRCSQVSKQWRKIAEDNRLWRKCFPVLSIPHDVDFKINTDAYIQKYFKNNFLIKSKKELGLRIQKFANRVTLKKMGTFICLFPFNPGCEVVIRLGYGRREGEVNVDLPWERKIKESYIFTRKLSNEKESGEHLALDLSSIDPVEFYVFNRKIEILSWKVLTCEASLKLPFSREENPIFLNKIENILKNRIQKLEVLDEVQFRIYTSTMFCLVIAIGVIASQVCF